MIRICHWILSDCIWSINLQSDMIFKNLRFLSWFYLKESSCYQGISALEPIVSFPSRFVRKPTRDGWPLWHICFCFGRVRFSQSIVLNDVTFVSLLFLLTFCHCISSLFSVLLMLCILPIFSHTMCVLVWRIICFK